MTTSRQRRGRGEGGIRKRADGRWEASIDLGWENGKRRRKFIYGRTRADVAAKLRRSQHSVDNGQAPTDGRLTVAELLIRWLDGQRHSDRSLNTIDNYAWAVRRLTEALGRKRLVDLTTDHVEAFLRSEVANGMSLSSLRRLRNVLVVALRYGERRGMVNRNAAALAEMPKCKDPVPRSALNPEQARALLGASTTERLGAMVGCGIMLGLRPGELTGLRREDLDLAAGRLTVTGSLKRERGQLRRGEVKRSRAGVRTIDLPPILVARLREHLGNQAKERLAAGPLWNEGGYLFASEVGTPLDPANVRRLFRRVADRAGCGHVVPYQLRHTAASLLLDSGATIEEVADVLGDNPTTVYRHYRHRMRESAQAAAAPMESLFGSQRTVAE